MAVKTERERDLFLRRQFYVRPGLHGFPRKESVVIAGAKYSTVCMPFLSPRQLCQSTEGINCHKLMGQNLYHPHVRPLVVFRASQLPFSCNVTVLLAVCFLSQSTTFFVPLAKSSPEAGDDWDG